MAWNFFKKHEKGAIFKNEEGKEFLALNPSAKGSKYARELKEGVRYTNYGNKKTDEKGKVVKLGKSGKDAQARAYRSGYLAARNDSARAWKAKNKKK